MKRSAKSIDVQPAVDSVEEPSTAIQKSSNKKETIESPINEPKKPRKNVKQDKNTKVINKKCHKC